MADISDEDKQALLGPNFKEIEAQAMRKKSALAGRWKSILAVAVLAAFASALFLADFGFALH